MRGLSSAPTWFTERVHYFFVAYWDHEPATDRSADSFVREFLGLDSRGHGCRRSDMRFRQRAGVRRKSSFVVVTSYFSNPLLAISLWPEP